MGYGASPESGGNLESGQHRMQSVKQDNQRLTKKRKEEILSSFEGWNADIVKIDKTSKGRIRIWYNNDIFWSD